MKTLILSFLLCATTSLTAGEIFAFERISEEAVYDDGLTISMEVIDAGNAMVDFKFALTKDSLASTDAQEAVNNVRIHEIYFDDQQCNIISNGSIQDFTGSVHYTKGDPRPHNLPAGKNVDFEATKADSWDAQPTTRPKTLDMGETLTLRYDINSGFDYDGLIEALYDKETNKLRAGLHIGGFANGKSASYVSVPEPSTYALMLLGLIALLIKFRKEQKLATH